MHYGTSQEDKTLPDGYGYVFAGMTIKECYIVPVLFMVITRMACGKKPAKAKADHPLYVSDDNP